MDNIDLAVLERSNDQAHLLRREKLIPAVVYGRGFENIHLKMDYQTFRRVFTKATFSTIINLDIDGKKKVPVLVHEVQYHPVTDDIVHVDFYAVRMDEKVTTHIALNFTGQSEAVKQGAVLATNKQEVEVTCLPGDLVHDIEVDLSALAAVGDTIRIEDLKVPSGIEILDSPEEPIVSAVEQKVVEETPAGEGAEAAAGEAAAEGDESGDSEEEKAE